MLRRPQLAILSDQARSLRTTQETARLHGLVECFKTWESVQRKSSEACQSRHHDRPADRVSRPRKAEKQLRTLVRLSAVRGRNRSCGDRVRKMTNLRGPAHRTKEEKARPRQDHLPAFQNLTRVNSGAAIDIGSTLYMAAVNPDSDDMPTRAFGTFTHDLHDLAT